MNPIPGVAGVDYPTFSTVPDTGFDCEKQNFPGIYSDTGAQCQVPPPTPLAAETGTSTLLLDRKCPLSLAAENGTSTPIHECKVHLSLSWLKPNLQTLYRSPPGNSLPLKQEL
jgi:hypothetical protein